MTDESVNTPGRIIPSMLSEEQKANLRALRATCQATIDMIDALEIPACPHLNCIKDEESSIVKCLDCGAYYEETKPGCDHMGAKNISVMGASMMQFYCPVCGELFSRPWPTIPGVE